MVDPDRLRVREVWAGRPWLEFDLEVVADTPDETALLLRPGTPFVFPAHPGGPHPWSAATEWGRRTVLQLRRPGLWWSVWKFFDGPDFEHWYVNFERPFLRHRVEGRDTLDVDDLELDLIVAPDGARTWKDVGDLHARLTEGRFGVDDLLHVLEAAAEMERLLDADERWWARWDGWTPRG